MKFTEQKSSTEKPLVKTDKEIREEIDKSPKVQAFVHLFAFAFII